MIARSGIGHITPIVAAISIGLLGACERKPPAPHSDPGDPGLGSLAVPPLARTPITLTSAQAGMLCRAGTKTWQSVYRCGQKDSLGIGSKGKVVSQDFALSQIREIEELQRKIEAGDTQAIEAVANKFRSGSLILGHQLINLKRGLEMLNRHMSACKPPLDAAGTCAETLLEVKELIAEQNSLQTITAELFRKVGLPEEETRSLPRGGTYDSAKLILVAAGVQAAHLINEDDRFISLTTTTTSLARELRDAQVNYERTKQLPSDRLVNLAAVMVVHAVWDTESNAHALTLERALASTSRNREHKTDRSTPEYISDLDIRTQVSTTLVRLAHDLQRSVELSMRDLSLTGELVEPSGESSSP